MVVVLIVFVDVVIVDDDVNFQLLIVFRFSPFLTLHFYVYIHNYERQFPNQKNILSKCTITVLETTFLAMEVVSCNPTRMTTFLRGQTWNILLCQAKTQACKQFCRNCRIDITVGCI